MLDYGKYEAKRQEILSVYQKELKTGILLAVLAVILAVVSFATEIGFLLVPAILLFVFATVFFAKGAKHYQAFRHIVKSEIITALLKQSFEQVTYSPKSMISVQRINQTQMIRRPDRYSGEDLITGSYKDVSFEVSDIDLKQRVETRDSKGNVHVSYQTYFKGRWYIFKFERTFKETLKIGEGSSFNMNRKGLVKIDTESIEFNKKFSIFASNQEHGFYLITSSMIEKLLELEKMHRGSIHYCFMNNELHVGVNDNKDYLEISIKKPINEETIKSFMTDINMVPAIINELRLDSQKFKNQK